MLLQGAGGMVVPPEIAHGSGHTSGAAVGAPSIRFDFPVPFVPDLPVGAGVGRSVVTPQKLRPNPAPPPTPMVNPKYVD